MSKQKKQVNAEEAMVEAVSYLPGFLEKLDKILDIAVKEVEKESKDDPLHDLRQEVEKEQLHLQRMQVVQERMEIEAVVESQKKRKKSA
jgi:hypothetical protein